MTPIPPLVLNPRGRAPGLIVVDHAGTAIPEGPGDPGLDPAWHGTHHFCDLGTADLAHLLAARIDVPVVLCRVSRLVIDVNRWLDDPRSVLTEVEGQPIPGNRALSARDRAARQEAVFWPYHAEVARLWDRQCARHARPFFLALHSCTRVFDGRRRPWDAGTIWHDSAAMSGLLLRALAREGGLTLGDNQPYSGRAGLFTVDRHCYGSGLPACGLEISNDLLETPGDRALWAGRLAGALEFVIRESSAPCP